MRILVIEDEVYLLQALTKSLEDEGYAVDGAADGDEGYYKATTWDYDAIVLDLMLPRRNGWEILTSLRRSKDTPVLMLTADDTLPNRVRGFDNGADDFLGKPFEMDELLARLRALIRRSKGRAHPCIVIGDVTINTAARTITKAGADVILTAREYSLVEFLAMSRGQVVTRTTLYEHLENEEDNSTSKVLEVHISRIRKKLGKDFITTRRGHGYIIHV